MKGAIEAVRIEGVRGILAPLEIGLQGRSFLLRGDNGSGKSSIVQGLRWALTGHATGPAGHLTREHLRHVRLPKGAPCRVEVDLAERGALVLEDGVCAPEGPLAAFRDACVRANPFFGREELNQVLQDKPADRMRYLRRFFDLNPVERLVEQLGQQRKSLKGAVERLSQKHLDALSKVTPATASGVRRASDLLPVHVAWAGDLGLDAAGATWSRLRELGQIACDRAGSEESRQRRSRLEVAQESLRRLSPPDHPSATLERLGSAESQTREASLAGLLEGALAAIGDRDPHEPCPVCEQGIEHDGLVTRLRGRLAVLSEVRAAEAGVERLATEWRTFLDSLADLERQATPAFDDGEPRRTGRELLISLVQPGVDDLAITMLARLERLRATVASEIGMLPDPAKAGRLAQFAAAVAGAAAALPGLEQAEIELAGQERLLEEVDAIHQALSRANKAVAAEELQRVKSTFSRFYARVHPPEDPSEVTRAPELLTHGHGSGTAILQGIFDGEVTSDVRDHYSDGHLDTVALCLFLAIRRTRADRSKAEDPRIVVLDDVILSVDLGHAGRLLDLLRDELGHDHQIIVVTHSEAFARSFERCFPAALGISIVRWSVTDGPRFDGRVSGVETLREALDSTGSNEALANAMRPSSMTSCTRRARPSRSASAWVATGLSRWPTNGDRS